jgi:hypothetical protein
MKQARRRALKTKGHRRVSFNTNHERYLDHRDRDAPVEPKMAGNCTSSARFGSVFMTMQETSDLRLQSGGAACCARRSVLEESTLNFGGQTIPLADKGRAETLQDSALDVQ